MKYLTLCFFILLSVLSYGTTFSESGLTDEQAVKLQKYAAEMKLAESEAQNIDKAQKISEWIDIGGQIGKGLSSCAKELGVEVNNFVQTPVGKLASVIIVWKLLGRDIMHFGFGTLFFMLSLIVWMYLYRKMCIVKSFKYGAKTSFWGRRSLEVTHYSDGQVDGTRLIMLLAAAILIVVSLFIIFS